MKQLGVVGQTNEIRFSHEIDNQRVNKRIQGKKNHTDQPWEDIHQTHFALSQRISSFLRALYLP